jgi:hypothetical protein
MYGIIEGEPFQVSARREGSGSDSLVIRFECNEGMGILGIRKVGRTDPPPSSSYEEDDIEPDSLRAGRFVHVLGSGQRQSYALSRISPEIAARLPTERWVELKPQTEYGFRYLVAPEEELGAGNAAVATATADAAPAAAAAVAVAAPAASDAPAPRAAASPADVPLPPRQTPMSPPLAHAALGALTKDQAIEHLKGEMAKVELLHGRVSELEEAMRKSRARERDLMELLARWGEA